MSQSDVHRDLVIQIAKEIKSRYSPTSLVTDIQYSPGDNVPPIIDGFRPDVYATLQAGHTVIIIAEAKTDGDLENVHTDGQLSAFVSYLENKGKGTFILSVTGCGADRAKTILRFLNRSISVKSTTLGVFDSCDLWILDSLSGVAWRLS